MSLCSFFVAVSPCLRVPASLRFQLAQADAVGAPALREVDDDEAAARIELPVNFCQQKLVAPGDRQLAGHVQGHAAFQLALADFEFTVGHGMFLRRFRPSSRGEKEHLKYEETRWKRFARAAILDWRFRRSLECPQFS